LELPKQKKNKKIRRINFMGVPIKGKTISKKLKDDKQEFEILSKQTFFSVKDKKRKILCIILNQDTTTTWLWKKQSTERFSWNKCMYYLVHDGAYKTVTGTVIMIFLEGISTPMSHKNIDLEEKEVTYKDPITNKMVKKTLKKIKGLKFDGKLIDMLLNRDLFAEFTKQRIDLPTTITAILLICVLVLGIVNIIVSAVI